METRWGILTSSSFFMDAMYIFPVFFLWRYIFRDCVTFSIQIVGKTLEYMVDHFCNRSV